MKIRRSKQNAPSFHGEGEKVGEVQLNVLSPSLLYFSLMCSAIVKVCGYRLRLHFDGYSDCHDFWVNANSPDIHPAGWCESTGHKLHTPKGQVTQHHKPP